MMDSKPVTKRKPNRFFDINEKIRANPEIIMDVKEPFKITYQLMHDGSITPDEKISLDSIIRTLYNEIRILNESRMVTVNFTGSDNIEIIKQKGSDPESLATDPKANASE